MIVFSKFEIICDGNFLASEIPIINGGFSIDYIRENLVSISGREAYNGDSALSTALDLLKDVNNILSVIGAKERSLTLSFYFEEQCPIGINQDELKKLSIYVNSLSIDCWPVEDAV